MRRLSNEVLQAGHQRFKIITGYSYRQIGIDRPRLFKVQRSKSCAKPTSPVSPPPQSSRGTVSRPSIRIPEPVFKFLPIITLPLQQPNMTMIPAFPEPSDCYCVHQTIQLYFNLHIQPAYGLQLDRFLLFN